MSTIATPDGTEIYYKDRGDRSRRRLLPRWPLSADAWDGQLLFLARAGFARSRTTGAVMAVPASPPAAAT